MEALPKLERALSPLEGYFRRREALFARIRSAQRLPSLLLHMTAVTVFCSAVYGLTVGYYAGGWQILYDAIKFPCVLLATLALCVLALYMLNSLVGARLSLRQTAAVVLAALFATTTILLALTPPLAFFMLTSPENYDFVVFINLVALVMAGVVGVSFAIQATSAVHEEEVVRKRCLRLMRAWMLLYGLVGAQMLWMFRPFFRQTEVFIRPLGEGGNVFEAFGRLLISLIKSLG